VSLSQECHQACRLLFFFFRGQSRGVPRLRQPARRRHVMRAPACARLRHATVPFRFTAVTLLSSSVSRPLRLCPLHPHETIPPLPPPYVTTHLYRNHLTIATSEVPGRVYKARSARTWWLPGLWVGFPEISSLRGSPLLPGGIRGKYPDKILDFGMLVL